MAIDDLEKRAAVIGVGRPWMRDKFPVATPDPEWRASSGLTYGGNPFTAIIGGDLYRLPPLYRRTIIPGLILFMVLFL